MISEKRTGASNLSSRAFEKEEGYQDWASGYQKRNEIRDRGMKTKSSAKSNDDGEKVIKRQTIQGEGLSLPGVGIEHASESLFADDEKPEERQSEVRSKANSSRRTSVSRLTRASRLHPSKAYASQFPRSESSSGGQRIVPSMDSQLDVPTPGAQPRA